VPIPIGIVDRKPLLGVLFGPGLFGLMVYLFITLMGEYRRSGTAPQQANLRTVPLPPIAVYGCASLSRCASPVKFSRKGVAPR
jgi:hypothetical protein